MPLSELLKGRLLLVVSEDSTMAGLKDWWENLDKDIRGAISGAIISLIIGIALLWAFGQASQNGGSDAVLLEVIGIVALVITFLCVLYIWLKSSGRIS